MTIKILAAIDDRRTREISTIAFDGIDKTTVY